MQIPDSVFDDIAQWVSKEYFKYLKSNWNKEQYIDESGAVQKWVALSEPYAKWKEKHFGDVKILVKEGALLNNFLVDYPAHGSFRISNDSVYAKTHQEGLSKRNIPARPMLFLDDEKITELILKYFNNHNTKLHEWIIAQFKN